MKLGILGGTFDPPHNGHLMLADAASRQLQLAQIVFIPAKQPPHKLGEPISPLKARVAMLERALHGKPAFVISMLEAERAGPSYTVDTLRALRHDLPTRAEIFFIMGLDSLENMPTWRQPDEIVKLCKLAVLKRPGYFADLDALEQKIPGVKKAVVFVSGPELNISASEIRARAARGESIREFVPRAVAEYIEQHRLYRIA
ncbi:MAG: nicotinate-nucleotide adenylyltransferase [Chloroflexi bacterium]|nr:nicotinate-nucleotide adenylyltransferase [Chloroflexota bacterium]